MGKGRSLTFFLKNWIKLKKGFPKQRSEKRKLTIPSFLGPPRYLVFLQSLISSCDCNKTTFGSNKVLTAEIVGMGIVLHQGKLCEQSVLFIYF